MSIAGQYQQYIGMPNILDLQKLRQKLETERDKLWKMHKGYEPCREQEKVVDTLEDKYNKLRSKINHMGNRKIKQRTVR